MPAWSEGDEHRGVALGRILAPPLEQNACRLPSAGEGQIVAAPRQYAFALSLVAVDAGLCFAGGKISAMPPEALTQQRRYNAPHK